MNEIEKSTRILREEHQLIENALIAMADIIKRLEKDNTLDRHQLCEMAHTRSQLSWAGRITRRKIFCSP